MKRIAIFVASALLTMGVVQAQEDASSMEELLQQIERGQSRDSQEARQREARFAQAQSEQQNSRLKSLPPGQPSTNASAS